MDPIDLDLTDVFDDLCDIKKDDDTTGDDYGQKALAALLLASAVPCKLLPLVSRKGGAESKVAKKDSAGNYTLYLFPIPGVTIDEHMWAFINGKRYDITRAVDPVISGAPMEIYLELVKP